MIVTTLAEYIEQKFGVGPSSLRALPPCPGCGMPQELFAITKCEDGIWRCGHCRLGSAREDAPAWELSWDDVRGHRTMLLAETDWTQLPDVPEATRLLWQPYRQALRDITLQVGSPADVAWPTQPTQEGN